MAGRALVIDDDAAVRRLLVEFLRVLGWETEEAADGVKGLALFDRAKPALVVTDVRMPGLSGWDVVVAIRRRSPRVPIVIVSGADVTPPDPALARAPALMILTKPVGLTQLGDAVARLTAAPSA
ncbi:MAG TPA: response regulator [Methylomirabilota bacterium]|nr:response regulator [Methylomirabilota bacterium]